MPSLPFVQAGRPSGYISAIMRFTHTSSGNASYFPNPYRSVHSATFCPRPLFLQLLPAEFYGRIGNLVKVDFTRRNLICGVNYVFCPETGAKRSQVLGCLAGQHFGEGKVYIPLSSSSPKLSQSLLLYPLYAEYCCFAKL